jgi:hypothetical protein
MKRHGTPELTAAVAAAATTAPAAEHGLQPMQEDPAAHLFMKKVLTWEAATSSVTSSSAAEQLSSASSASFAQALLQRLGSGSGELLHWCASNRGAFVVTALLGVPSVSAAVQKELASHIGAIKKLAAQGSKGAEVQCALLLTVCCVVQAYITLYCSAATQCTSAVSSAV